MAVRTEGLVKRYDGTLAVAGVDLEIATGEIHGLVGPNGAGKTTTLRMLATVLEPTAGQATVAGIDVVKEPDSVRRVIGYMPDTFGVYDDMRVWEYLDFFARCYGLPATRRRQMIGDLLELVDLADKRDAYVQALSRGMQQRLCLAHALVHDPQRAAARRAGVGSRPAGSRRAARAAARAARAGQDDRHQQPHPARARGALHQRHDHRPRATSSLPAAWPTSKPACGRGAVLKVRILGDEVAVEAAAAFFRADGARGRGRARRRRLAGDRLHR